jgi:anti-repressor protein
MRGGESVNELQIFENEEFGKVRTLVKDGEPWFVASDVCECLGLANPTVSVNRLDYDERAKFNLGRQGWVNIVNEYGLYNLVLGSRKPEAKNFKRWVTHEVLPAIRKHGGYLTPDKVEEILTNPDSIIRLATQLKEERAKRAEAEKVIEEQRPKALFADAVSASKTSILIGALAKLIRQNGVDVGQKRLFEWLRKKGYLIKSGNDKNMPTQRSMEQGLFEVKEGSYVDGDGVNRITRTTKVTGKGQLYFVNKFLAAARG